MLRKLAITEVTVDDWDSLSNVIVKVGDLTLS